MLIASEYLRAVINRQGFNKIRFLLHSYPKFERDFCRSEPLWQVQILFGNRRNNSKQLVVPPKVIFIDKNIILITVIHLLKIIGKYAR